MSQALYRKWRPARFDQVIGQEHVTRTLQQSVAADRVGHAYLFCGPRGTGKTTSARLLAKAVNCLNEDLGQRPDDSCPVCKAVNEGRFLDLIEIDAASNTGVDDIRDLRDKINFAPNQGRFKVYIIDEVHMLSTAAFNALLKTLEEPPAHAMFVLATTEEHKVPLTIKSRCQQFNFRLLTVGEISDRLRWLASQENLTLEPEALDLIARQGAGSVRDAESLLDQLVVAPGDTITLERAQMVLGTAASQSVTALVDAWLNADGTQGLRIIHTALASGTDARQFCRQMVAHLRHLLLLQAAGSDLMLDVPAEQQAAMLVQAQRAGRAELIAAIKGFNEAALKPVGSWQPQLPLEMAFIELLPDEPAPLMLSTPPAPLNVTLPPSPRETPVSAPQTTAVARVDEDASEEETGVVETAVVAETPEAVETAAPASAPSAKPVPVSLEAVQLQWRAMVAHAGQENRNLPALLAMCKPLAVEGAQIVLGFDYPIFKEKLEKMPQAGRTIGDAFTALLGSPCSVRYVVTSEYTVPIRKEEFHALARELGGVVREEEDQ